MKTKTFVCDGQRSDDEVFREARDWVSKGTYEDPRFAFITKSRVGE